MLGSEDCCHLSDNMSLFLNRTRTVRDKCRCGVKLLYLPVAFGTVVETRPVSCVRERQDLCMSSSAFSVCCAVIRSIPYTAIP
jgi:hypothetical protein